MFTHSITDSSSTTSTQPYIKNILLLALAGIGASIGLAFVVKFLIIYFYEPDLIQREMFTAKLFIFVFTNFFQHLLAGGIIMTFAYQYGYVLLNKRNVLISISVALIVSTGFLILDSPWVHSFIFNFFWDWLRETSWHYQLRDLIGVFVSIPRLLLAFGLIGISALIFSCYTKPMVVKRDFSIQQSRTMMLLSFTCLLTALFLITSFSQASLFFSQLVDLFPNLKESYFWLTTGYMIFLYISSLIFLWISYQFAAVHVNEDNTIEPHGIVRYVLLSFFVFIVLCIATGFLLLFVLSKLPMHNYSMGDMMGTCSVLSLFLLACLCGFTCSPNVCVIIFILCILQLIAAWIIPTLSPIRFRSSDKEALIFMTVIFITLELLVWLLYSIAIWVGVRKMIQPTTAHSAYAE